MDRQKELRHAIKYGVETEGILKYWSTEKLAQANAQARKDIARRAWVSRKRGHLNGFRNFPTTKSGFLTELFRLKSNLPPLFQAPPESVGRVGKYHCSICSRVLTSLGSILSEAGPTCSKHTA